MKLLVRKLWFKGCSIDDVMDNLFKIPQFKELFDSYEYAGEMRPRGMKVFSCYWPADDILKRVPESKDISLVLTSMDLQGDYGRIYGRGRDRKAISSNDGFFDGYGTFCPASVNFNATTFGEIGHALGLEHHNLDKYHPCEMSHNEWPDAEWRYLEEVRFCKDCYKQLIKNHYATLSVPIGTLIT